MNSVFILSEELFQPHSLLIIFLEAIFVEGIGSLIHWKWHFQQNNNNNDLLTDPLGGSSLLNYINYNYKINQIKLFTNYAVEAGLTEYNYNNIDIQKAIITYGAFITEWMLLRSFTGTTSLIN